MNHFGLLVAMLATAFLSGCASQSATIATPSASVETPYRLGSGDRLRVIVFGQDNLSNSYSVDGAGDISMPLIGRVRAQGLATAELERTIEARLRQGFLREPSVSVEVEAYRPFFVLGEVALAGQYPFIMGMTVQNGDRGRRRLHAARGREQRRNHPRHRWAPGDVSGAADRFRSGRATP